MTTHNPVDTSIVAHDFLVAMHGKLEQTQIDAAIAALKADMAAYPATITFTNLVFYTVIEVAITGGETFRGTMGGLTTPGGGAAFGATVYTDDIDALYANTVTFQINVTPVYLSILFFDAQNNLLGSCQAGGIFTTIGVGGGKGEWS
ncbi:MAG TPA: VapA/VapB family virulence-associated protein [Herpetosiphonaceae bacterium]